MLRDLGKGRSALDLEHVQGIVRLFGIDVSDAHCGMRALRRSALPVLDLHSTGMEFASEMVIRATRERLDVREVPIELHPRVGSSKLSRS